MIANTQRPTQRNRGRRMMILDEGFSPANILGLQLWLDANDPSTLFQDAAKTTAAGDGDVVGAWADKSGNGKDGTQSTTAAKPNYQFNIVNGKPIVRFDGTDDLLNIGDLSSLTASEIFIVVKIDADPPPSTAKTGLWDFGTSVQDTHFPLQLDSIIYDEFGSTVRKVTVDPVTTLAQFNIYNVVSISGEWTSRLNNLELFTTGINTVGFIASPILGRSTNVTFFLDGDIAEVILYNAKLSDGNRALINSYISTKYGITLS